MRPSPWPSHSGAGKSTCAALLTRMWDVTGGAIRVGGHDIRDFPQHSTGVTSRKPAPTLPS
ncbi:hypothetical protein [Sphaerisporangium rubeum]|uniref:ABC-type transport system involved in cytochrome bd biosynthesis fused ATPase/permease subunit n=1 Tax=Sphaerisporangium rubeum TaxID=321317 RepID=A0A7X0ICS0_9ACTN|nr:hypothetical protein [Sphaerisporangium rubeum]MBB6472859.1 ABC-type transport system involved in cytochrome bd biosynthesis fused ATPase/permease subunit [Sphaerisporangium rubeum]